MKNYLQIRKTCINKRLFAAAFSIPHFPFSISSAAFFIFNCSLFFALVSCSVQKKIATTLRENLIDSAARVMINNPQLSTAHIGISIYDADEKKVLYDFNGGKYFIPASNTKIATCYAAMKYLGDSLVGLKYKIKIDSVSDGIGIPDTTYILWPTADPTFLHPDFKEQPVYDFLKKINGTIEWALPLFDKNFFGEGWAWDDNNEAYMPPKTFFPIYGNVVNFKISSGNLTVEPKYFQNKNLISIATNKSINILREINSNHFYVEMNNRETKEISVPFYPSGLNIPNDLINDTIHKKIFKGFRMKYFNQNELPFIPDIDPYFLNANKPFDLIIIHSQPTDSLLKIMMHRSDNFYAEQSLLMVSNETLGIMNDEKIIDTILNSDFKNIPQKPRWVDGSGLSRYNLFTPNDFIWILDKMRNEFSWNRITTIFQSGGTGTLSDYYKNFPGKIFAKSGTLSNNLALSGYSITPKNKTLIFSVMVGNHMDSNADVRKSIEDFLTSVIQNY